MNTYASRRLANAEFRMQSAEWILLVGPSGLEPPIKILSLRIRFGKSRFRFLIVFVSYLVLLVGPSGLEPPTSCLSGTRSNLLSYEPMWLVSDFLLTWLLPFWKVSLVSFLFKESNWWRWWDSNPWPPACRAGALPAELHPHLIGFCFSLLFSGSGNGFIRSLLLCWHWAIFPCRFQQSIFTTAELNFCVRNGYRWTLCVCNTNFCFSNSSSLNIEQHYS